MEAFEVLYRIVALLRTKKERQPYRLRVAPMLVMLLLLMQLSATQTANAQTRTPTVTQSPERATATVTPTRQAPREPIPTATLIPTELVEIVQTENITRTIATVNVNTANLRGGPGTDHSVRGRATMGEEFDVIGQNGEGTWLQVESPDQNERWISESLVLVEQRIIVEPSLPSVTGTPSPTQAITEPDTMQGTDGEEYDNEVINPANSVEIAGEPRGLRFIENFPHYEISHESVLRSLAEGDNLSLYQSPNGSPLDLGLSFSFAIDTGIKKDGFVQAKLQLENSDGTFRFHYGWVKESEVIDSEEAVELAAYTNLPVALEVLAAEHSNMQKYDDNFSAEMMNPAYSEAMTNIIVRILAELQPPVANIDWTNENQVKKWLTEYATTVPVEFPLPIRMAVDEYGEPIANWALSKVGSRELVDLSKGIRVVTAEVTVWNTWKGDPIAALESTDSNVRDFAKVCQGLTPDMFILYGSTPNEYSTDAGGGAIAIVLDGQLTIVNFATSANWNQGRLDLGQAAVAVMPSLMLARLAITAGGIEDGSLSAVVQEYSLGGSFWNEFSRALRPYGVKP